LRSARSDETIFVEHRFALYELPYTARGTTAEGAKSAGKENESMMIKSGSVIEKTALAIKLPIPTAVPDPMPPPQIPTPPDPLPEPLPPEPVPPQPEPIPLPTSSVQE